MTRMKIKRVDPRAKTPEYAHLGDAGLDLRILDDVRLDPMQRIIVGCGLAVSIPRGHVGLLFSRSGLSSKQGVAVANGVGVIDSGYRGEVRIPLINFSDKPVCLSAGDRVCQLVIVPYRHAYIQEVDDLDETERGVGGLGSTGYE